MHLYQSSTNGNMAGAAITPTPKQVPSVELELRIPSVSASSEKAVKFKWVCCPLFFFDKQQGHSGVPQSVQVLSSTTLRLQCVMWHWSDRASRTIPNLPNSPSTVGTVWHKVIFIIFSPPKKNQELDVSARTLAKPKSVSFTCPSQSRSTFLISAYLQHGWQDWKILKNTTKIRKIKSMP